jgi:predicted nucleic acid-binding protein
VRRVVLDASALMAFFEDRPGAEKVEELIGLAVAGKTELLMTVVNWGEVYYSVWLAQGREAAAKVSAEIAQLPIEIVDADFELTKVAAGMRAQYKLPYADCFAAALTKVRKASLLASDQDFRAVDREISVEYA